MSDRGKKTKTLGEMTAYERWELPNIGADGSMESVQSIKKTEKVKPLTADDIEQIRQQAYKDGFDEGRNAGQEAGRQEGREEGRAIGIQEGHAEGLQKGLQAAQLEIDQKNGQLERIISQFHTPLAEQFQLVQESLVNVAVAISRAVIFKKLEEDRSIIASALESILSTMPDFDEGTTIYVNSADFELVSEQANKLGAAFAVTIDDSITAGGLKIRTSNQLIDYTVEKRFQKSVQGMLSAAYNSQSDVTELPSSINELGDFAKETLSEEIPEQELSEPISPRESDGIHGSDSDEA